MCGLNPRSRLVLAKLEATPGTDPIPQVGTDDLFVSMDSPGIKLGVTQVGNEPASPTGYELPAAIATIKPSATYRIPLYGKGRVVGPPTSPVLPRWLSVFLASCGHVNRDASSATQVVWTPDSIFPRTTAPTTGTVTANLCTFTVYDYLARDGAVDTGTKILQAMVGCRVSQVRFVLTVGQWAFLEVDILGLSVQPAGVTDNLSNADLDDVRTDFVRANAAQSEFNFTAGSYVLQSQSTTWTIDFGATQEEGDSTSAGVATVGTRQALVTASMNPIQNDGLGGGMDITQLSAVQFEQEDGTYGMAGSMTPEGQTVDTGYTFRVAAPAVQIVFDYDTSGSVVRLPTTAKAVSADSTTPPISLTLS